jgi:hypothetical protein
MPCSFPHALKKSYYGPSGLPLANLVIDFLPMLRPAPPRYLWPQKQFG